MPKAKVLVLDIETAPLKVYNWSLWQDSTSVNMIETEWHILAVCAKWLGQRPMYKDLRGGRGGEPALLKWVWLLL
ncbi:MAG: ribonuclease H-like domain-containing protein, partial [Burkholderiales bacterium]